MRCRFFGNQLDTSQDTIYGLDQLVLGTSVPPSGTRYGLQLVGSGLKMGALATPTARCCTLTGCASGTRGRMLR